MQAATTIYEIIKMHMFATEANAKPDIENWAVVKLTAGQ
jgi:hypothetical protein